MKRKVLSIIGVAAISAAVAFNVNVGTQSDSLTDIALVNLEALANVEATNPPGGGGGEKCYPLTDYLKNGNTIKCTINGNCKIEKDLIGKGSYQNCSNLVY